MAASTPADSTMAASTPADSTMASSTPVDSTMAASTPAELIMISGITKDKPSMGYFSFATVNACAFVVILGFFTGSGMMHSSIEPCMQLVAKELAQEFKSNTHHEQEMQRIHACLVETDAYVMSNADGHYFQVLLPLFFVAVANIFIFSGLFYVRAVRNFRFLDPLREQKKASSLTMQQDGDIEDQAAYPTVDVLAYPDAKTIGSSTPPEATNGTPPEAAVVAQAQGNTL